MGGPRRAAAGRDTLDEVLAAVPPSRLPAHPLVSAEPGDRLRHARGQSLPDWVALRSGRIAGLPRWRGLPARARADVAELLAYAATSDARLIPYGGGTSVVGHINPPPGEQPGADG
jgi:alkyldihydroxyacetonephosphate synthase